MGNYDNILRPIFAELLSVLQIVGYDFAAAQLEEVDTSLAATLERRADFLRLCKTGEKTIILHIEIQTNDEPKMVYRMLEYLGLLSRKFECDVWQFVIYIGGQKPKMPIRLEGRHFKYGFVLVDLSDISYRKFLAGASSASATAAILADFEQDPAETVVERILKRLLELQLGQLELNKRIKELEILSQLRGLQSLVVKKVREMIYYDLQTDERFLEGKEQGLQEGLQKGLQEGLQKGLQEGLQEGLQKGLQEGLQKGLQEGLQKGLQKGAFEAARRAIAKGLSDDVIVDVTGLSPEQVQALRAQEYPPANGA